MSSFPDFLESLKAAAVLPQDPIDSADAVATEVHFLCLRGLGHAPPRDLFRPLVDHVLLFAAPGPLVPWTVALSTPVADLLGDVLARRFRWFLWSVWRGGPEPPVGMAAPGEAPLALVESLVEARTAAASRRHPSATVADPLVDALGKVQGRRRGHEVGASLDPPRRPPPFPVASAREPDPLPTPEIAPNANA